MTLRPPKKIVLAGEGGQGVQAIAMILAEGAYEAGKEAVYIPNFGVEQRGGVSLAFVQVGDDPIEGPKFKTGDVVVALSERAVWRTQTYVGPETILIYEAGSMATADELPCRAQKCLPVSAVQIAKEEFSPRVFNIIILGALLSLAAVITREQAEAAIEKRLGYKFAQNPQLREMNFHALARGMSLVK